MVLKWFGSGRSSGKRRARATSFIAGLVALAGLVAISAAPAQAQDDVIGIELNRLQDVKGACRISLVFTNGLDKSVEALSIETVLFNKDGAVERFLVLKSNPLEEGKVRVQQFDAREISCADIGRILLNDIKECSVEGLRQSECLAAIKPSSRTNVDFFSTQASGAKKDPKQ